MHCNSEAKSQGEMFKKILKKGVRIDVYYIETKNE